MEQSFPGVKPQILVVENDQFNRLALADMLELLNYTVIAVENEELAKEELLKKETYYDLIILDSQMGGLELFTFIKERSKLRNIPVVMLSERGKPINLPNGVKDFLAKPFTMKDVKCLAVHIENNSFKKIDKNSFAKYQFVRLIGQGPSSSVYLAKNTLDGEFYAVKTVELELKTPQERKVVENEVGVFKRLKGPTIIRYYEHFIQSDKLYIVMEYGGENLSEKIAEHRSEGHPIPNETILDCIAQLIPSILLLQQSKYFLIRDAIQPKKLFFKDDVVKLGNCDIYSPLDLQDLPYFMPPEECKGETASFQSDVWALGCVAYQLAALKKPFDSTRIAELLNMICEKEPAPLPEHTSLEVKMLISAMLHKDPAKRPSIYNLSQNPVIHERILKFIRGTDFEQSILSILESTKSDEKSSPSALLLSKFEDLAETIRKTIELKVMKVGFLQKEENVFTGEDLVNWFKNELNISDPGEVGKVVLDMMNQGLLHCLDGDNTFQNTSKALYRFQVDERGTAANMERIYNEPRDPQQLTQGLLIRTNEILNELRIEVNLGEVDLNIDKLNDSKSYKEFKKEICQLQATPITSLEQNEKLVFFLNIYQIMHVHKLFKDKTEKSQPHGLFNLPSKSHFYYDIDHMDFTLEDIIHGILRGNKKAPDAYFFKNFSQSDPRNAILQIHDPRVLFVLMPENTIPKNLEIYHPIDLDEKLDKRCKEYLSNSVTYNPLENELVLPHVFKLYRDDFESQNNLVDFVLKHSKLTINPGEIHDLLEDGKLSISYKDI